MAIHTKLFQKASSALSSGRYLTAINLVQKLLLNDPNNLELIIMMGEAYMRNEQFSEAAQYFAKAVGVDNKNLTALNNFGASLIRIRKLNEAKEILLYALELDPKNIDAHVNLGTVYQGLIEPQKSLEVAFKVIELNPSSFIAYNNLGCALGDLLQLEDAREAYLTALALNPSYMNAIINLAQLEAKLGNELRCIELYEEALTSNNITAGQKDVIKYYLSHSYLFIGKLDKGWDYYDFGFADLLPTGAFRSERKFVQPVWIGNLDEKRTILIWREQGLGDEILFSSCLSDIHESNLNIILECDPRLVDIFQRTYPNFKVRGESINAEHYSVFNDFEIHLAIGSLPRYFRRDIHNFERPATIWHPKPEAVNLFRTRLEPFQNKILVGICWRSGNLSVDRNSNYTALQDWGILLSNPKFQFVNLLHGECEGELVQVEELFGIQILRWSDIDLRNDLESVLGLISELDCVVSIGSAVSVIAGAAGLNTLVLLRQSWVLMGKPSKYHWFPNVKPFAPGKHEHVGVNIKNLEPYITKRAH